MLANVALQDSRGSFCEFWNSCLSDKFEFVPSSAATSFNAQSNTLRGLHFQAGPREQTKLVHCSHGSAYDVVVDLRPHSPTYLQWQSIQLDSKIGTSVLVPKGCAHGFVTLEPNTVITYLIEGPYEPEAGRVARWNDPVFAIFWPVNNPILSDRDRDAADFAP